MEFRTGQRVTDNVELLRPLGEGGQATVWVARHIALNIEVAVKFLSEELDGDPEAEARFRREAAVSARIKSAHVMQIFDHGFTPDGTPYIVMELHEGETLFERLDRGPLPLPAIRTIFTQLCKALDSSHRAAIVHRDIKPENIFLANADGGVLVKVFDFGIAKQAQLPKVSRLTGVGMMIGTPNYMSPEQVMNSREVDHRADLWAAAVVLYEMLTADFPFDGEDVGELCTKLLKGNFEPPSFYRSELAPPVDTWFQRAFNKEPDQRFRNAAEMAHALVRCIPASADELEAELIGSSDRWPQPSVEVQPAGGATTTLRQRIRMSKGALIAASVVLVALVTGGIIFASGRSPGSKTPAASAVASQSAVPQTAAQPTQQPRAADSGATTASNEPTNSTATAAAEPSTSDRGSSQQSPASSSSWHDRPTNAKPPGTKTKRTRSFEDDPGF